MDANHYRNHHILWLWYLQQATLNISLHLSGIYIQQNKHDTDSGVKAGVTQLVKRLATLSWRYNYMESEAENDTDWSSDKFRKKSVLT
jgi:hypothetical protein